METTFKAQPQTRNPFQSAPEPVQNSSSSTKQRPSTDVQRNQPLREAEYSHEGEKSYEHDDDLQRDPESEQQENSEDYDDNNVSFASPEDEGESQEKVHHRGRNLSKEEQDRSEDSPDNETSPEGRPDGDQDLLQELNGIKEELTQSKDHQRTGTFQSTPSKYHKKCTDLSPRSILHHFRDYSPNRAVTDAEFKEHYDKFCIAFLKKKEEELLKKRKEKSDLEVAELKDRPTLISKPNARKYIPLMDRTPLLDAKRAREIEKLRQERDEKLAKEEEELTFKPKINERSKSICSPKKEDRSRSRTRASDLSPAGGKRLDDPMFKPKINENSNNIAKGIISNTSDDVVDRLYLRADKDNDKKNELAKQLTPNFTPALNRKSQRIAQQIDETQRMNASQYQSAEGDSKHRSGSKNRETDPDLYAIDQASDADLLEILRQFNQMLKQKNESPINLEQLSALMASYADKRRNDTNEPRLTTEEELSESEAEDEEQVPHFATTPARRCDTEVSEKSSAKEKTLKSRPKNNTEANEDELAKIQENLQQLQENLQGMKKQGANAYSPVKKQTAATKIPEQKSSQSPKKNGTLMNHLIKNPRANNKNDDPPVTTMREDLRQKAEEIAAEKAGSPKKGSPKKGDAKTKSATKDSKNRDLTPKGTASQKSFGSAAQKATAASGTKEKTKGKKGSKKGKKVKSKEDKDEDVEKSTKKTKKSQDALSSKNALDGWKSPPQELQDANDEEVFQNEGEDDNDTKTQEDAKTTERLGEQTFGTEEHEFEERPRDAGSRKSLSSQKGKDQVGSKKDTSFENSKAGKSRKSSEADKNNDSQDQFIEVEREVVIEREGHTAEKAKARGAPRSRAASEYSRGQMSKAVLEEEEEEDQGSDGKDGHETIRSHGSRNKIGSNKSSRNQLDDDANSQKGSQKEGSIGPNARGSKSLFSTHDRNSVVNNNVDNINNINNVNNTNTSNNQYNQTGENVNKHHNSINDSVNKQSEVNGTNKSFDSDDDYYTESQNTIRESTRQRGDSGASLSTNQRGKKDSEDNKRGSQQAVPTDYKSPRADSERSKGDGNMSFAANKNDQQRGDQRFSKDLTSPRASTFKNAASVVPENDDLDHQRRSRKNAPLRCEVMNTETIQIQPPHQHTKNQYKYAMDGSDKNYTSASSRGLKQMAEHIVKKFKNYDQQVKQTKKEYKVEVSRSESRSRSPETQEPPQGKKSPNVPNSLKTSEKRQSVRPDKEEDIQARGFKTPEKRQSVHPNKEEDVQIETTAKEFKTPEKREMNRFEKEENGQRDISAQKKTRGSVYVPVMTAEAASGKKNTQAKRHSVAVPMKHAFGK